MQRCIDNAITIAKYIAACGKSDCFNEGCDGAAVAVREHITARYPDTKVNHLGHGFFSHVFTMREYFGDSVVIKACVDSGELGFVYLADCMQNPGPHLPVVHYVERMFDATGAPLGYVAVLKKLRELNHTEKMLHADVLEEVRHSVRAVKPDASEFHRTAHAVFSKYGEIAHWDLHPGNVMCDELNTLIITDPITSLKDKSENGKSRELLTDMMRSLGLPEAA